LFWRGALAPTAAGGQEGERGHEHREPTHWRTSPVEAARRRCHNPASSAIATIAPAPARISELFPSAKLRTSLEKRTPKLTIGSSATVAVSPNCSRAH
jgi:hypothetical protein